MQNNKELITPIKRSVFIIEGFFISLVRLCPPQSGPFDGCGHLVGSTIINRWFYAGELQVLCILHPYAVTTRIEFSNRSQVYDVALFQHLCHSIDTQFKRNFCFCLMDCGVAARHSGNLVNGSFSIG